MREKERKSALLHVVAILRRQFDGLFPKVTLNTERKGIDFIVLAEINMYLVKYWTV